MSLTSPFSTTTRSFAAVGGAGKILSLNGKCAVDRSRNGMVMVTEGGRTNVHVQNNADGSPVYKEGKLMCVGRPRASGVLFRMTLSALCTVR